MQNDADLKEGAWTFKDKALADRFDGYVRAQLPWYDLATGIVRHFVRAYLPEGGAMIDIGASTGNIGRACAEVITQRSASLSAFDPSPDMVAIYDAPGKITCGPSTEANYSGVSVSIWFLTAQFLSPTERRDELKRAIEEMKPGGALIIFDRFIGAGGYAGQVSSRLAMAGKYEQGATPDEIVRKELSLVGIQRPLDPAEMPGHPIEVFRCGDFAGYVIES